MVNSMVSRRLGVLIGRGAAVVAGVILAAGTAGGTVVAQPGLSDQDRQFLEQAHQGNLAEIAAGKLAQSRGTSQQVKDIAATLVADHTRLDTAVKELASASGVRLPATPNAEQQAMQAQLERAAAGDFDAVFVAGQLAAHSQSMRLGRTELSAGRSPEVKKAAADAAPVIEAHHDHLVAAARQLGLPSSIDTGNAGLADTPSSAWNPLVAILAGAGLVLAAAGAVGLRRAALR